MATSNVFKIPFKNKGLQLLQPLQEISIIHLQLLQSQKVMTLKLNLLFIPWNILFNLKFSVLINLFQAVGKILILLMNKIVILYRSSLPEVFYEIDVLEN